MREPEHTWPVEKDVQMVNDTDTEVKYSLKVNLTSSSVNIINALEMKRKETWLNLTKKQKKITDGPIVDMNLLQKSETAVIKLYQRRVFQKEISTLENRNIIFKASLS